MSEQSAEAKVKLAIYARGLLKHNLQSQNIKFTATEIFRESDDFPPKQSARTSPTLGKIKLTSS